MKRKLIQSYILEENYKWIEEMVKSGEFRSKSHAVEECIQREKRRRMVSV